MEINASELIEKIRLQGEKNRTSEEAEDRNFRNALVSRLDEFNSKYIQDAKTLCDIYRALRSAGLKYTGDNDRFIVDDAKSGRSLGFIEWQDGSICLGVAGGGVSGDNQLLLARHGNYVEAAFYKSNDSRILGEASYVVSVPELHGVNMEWVRKFANRVNTLINEFEQFRDEYIAYAQQQLD